MADPLRGSQWHLAAIDLDSLGGEFKGSGIAVGVYDDGLQKNHEDLAANYDATKEFSYGGTTYNPQGSGGQQTHGTAVAGIIAGVEDNGLGGVGIASSSKITGVDILGNAASTGTLMLEAMRHMANFDLTSNSWNWSYKYDNNGVFGDLFDAALGHAAANGRGGLGTIITVAAGNDWLTDRRDANYSEFSASRWTITVGATDDQNHRAIYSNTGASILVSGPSNGGASGIVTTDESGSSGYASGNYTTTFGGTSAATPVVSGVIALMLEASGKQLGWRDVQDILAITADYTTGAFNSGTMVTNQTDYWTVNGANNVDGGGFHFSNDFGFGRVDAFEAVRMSEVWSLFNTARTSANEQTGTATSGTTKSIPNGSSYAEYQLSVGASLDIDYVTVTLTMTHGNMENVKIELISPDGTNSLLLTVGDPTKTNALSNESRFFGSNEFRGELSAGTWTLRVYDTVNNGTSGSISSVGLNVYGDTASINNVYHYTDDFLVRLTAEPARSTITDTNGGTDWLNFAALKGVVTANLSALSVVLAGVSTLAIAAATVIENIVSGDGADSLTGSDIANVLVGMRGADTLSGLADADTLTGGTGNDTIDGGTGTDLANYSGARADYSISKATVSGVDVYTIVDNRSGKDGTDQVRNVEGYTFSDGYVAVADLLSGSVGVAPPPGGSAPVKQVGGNGDDTLTGGSGSDTLIAAGGDDLLSGEAGNDLLNGGLGADTIDGGDDIDTVDYSNSNAAVTVDLSSNAAQSGGHAAGDILIDIERIVGSRFNDVFFGGYGYRYDGRGGLDRVSYAAETVDLTVDLRITGAQDNDDVLVAIEAVTGGSGDDLLIGSSTANSLIGGNGADTLIGGSGADTLTGGGGTDTVTYSAVSAVDVDLMRSGAQKGGSAQGDILSSIEVVIGGATGRNLLRGEAGDNTLTGGAGDDLLEGRGGADVLNGGAGQDTASYASSGSAINVGIQYDFYSGGDAAGDVLTSIENLIGSAYNDIIFGSNGANLLQGGGGDDDISDLQGNDTVDGGAGNDYVTWYGGNDVLMGSSGSDTIDFSPSTGGVTMTSGSVTGPLGSATMSGFERYVGSTHDDRMIGAAAAERFDGGAGNDTMTGGGGKDTFFFFSGSGDDVITDFARRQDKLDFRGYDPSDLTISTVGTDILIESGTDSVRLLGRAGMTLTSSDFIF